MKMVSLKQPCNQITKSLLCPQHTQYNGKLYRCTSSAKNGDTSAIWMVDIDRSILHHAFISIFIALWAVITRYVTILMAILSCFTRFIMKRENGDSWDSG